MDIHWKGSTILAPKLTTDDMLKSRQAFAVTMHCVQTARHPFLLTRALALSFMSAFSLVA